MMVVLWIIVVLCKGDVVLFVVVDLFFDFFLLNYGGVLRKWLELLI